MLDVLLSFELFDLANDLLDKTSDDALRRTSVNRKANGVLSWMHTAAITGKIDLFDFLLRNGADINIFNETEFMVKESIDDARQPLFSVPVNTTPLHLAVRHGGEDTAIWFIEHGARFDIFNGEGLTAFHRIAQKGWGCALAECVAKNPRIVDLKAKKPSTSWRSDSHVGKTASAIIQGRVFDDNSRINHDIKLHLCDIVSPKKSKKSKGKKSKGKKSKTLK